MNCWRSAVTMQRSCASSVVAKADRRQQVCADLFGAVIFGRNVTAGRLPRFWRGSGGAAATTDSTSTISSRSARSSRSRTSTSSNRTCSTT